MFKIIQGYGAIPFFFLLLVGAIHIIASILVVVFELPYSVLDVSVMFSLSPLLGGALLPIENFRIFKNKMLLLNLMLTVSFSILISAKTNFPNSIFATVGFFGGYYWMMVLLYKLSIFSFLRESRFAFFNIQIAILSGAIALDDPIVTWLFNPSLWINYAFFSIVNFM